MNSYPEAAAVRDRFVVERRGTRETHDPRRHQGVIVEDERAGDGSIARVATVFLTGRECPWRCVMCDLWRYTIAEDTPVGAIPAQIAAARIEADRQVESGGGCERGGVAAMKLYNAGSFFDPRAVPESDYDDIAAQLVGLERVIVESHPALIGARVDRFVEALARQCADAGRMRARRSDAKRADVAPPRLEVAMGLETTHPVALEGLHKRITLARFADAAAALRRREVALRVFLLISPPFIPADEQDAWLLRSIDVAFDCGASVVSLVPTRSGNGAMEALRDAGQFEMPTLDDIERSFAAALAHVHVHGHAAGGRSLRVFVDLWDLRRFADPADRADPEAGDADFLARQERLALMNLEQRILLDAEPVHETIARARREVSS